MNWKVITVKGEWLKTWTKYMDENEELKGTSNGMLDYARYFLMRQVLRLDLNALNIETEKGRQVQEKKECLPNFFCLRCGTERKQQKQTKDTDWGDDIRYAEASHKDNSNTVVILYSMWAWAGNQQSLRR